MKHLGDITKISGYEAPIVDCIIGGSPCQDLSTAGKRAGLEGQRSGLFMEQIRIVKEMRKRDGRDNKRTGEFLRPRYMVWENVPGAFSSPGAGRRGEDFQAVLTEIAKVAAPGCPDVPLPEGGRWPKSGCIMGRGEDGCPFSIAWRLHDAQFWGVPQRRKRIALVADFGGVSAPEILFIRKSLFGDPEKSGSAWEEAPGDIKRSAGETGSTISFQERAGKPGGGKGILIQNERMGALSTTNNQSICCYSISANTSGAMKSSNPNAGIRMVDIARTIDMNGASPACDQGGIAVVCSQMYSIGHDVRSAKFTQDEITDPLTATDYKDPIKINDCRKASHIVRKLTPMECERLQGFPDGWTDIGEWTDTKGKKHKPSDSARYKALGNSIALPFWFWLLRRISAQYERPATMASLFDGIGGFPLCWEKCNGKGTAIWASEIEEFPIAVTKMRFPDEE